MSTASKFITILLSVFIFESMYTPQSMGGLMVALAGGSLYSPVGVWAVRCVSSPGVGGGGGGGDSGGGGGDGGGDGGGGGGGGSFLGNRIKSCIGARRVTWEPGVGSHSPRTRQRV